MIIDHVWLIFFPEQITRRIIWRTAFPIFLFLVWFNYFYERNTKLWVRWALLQAFLRWWRLLWATSIVYLNILIAIGLVRIILGYLKRIDTVRVECIVCIVSIILIPYSLSIIDYGTLSVLFWLWGYRARKYWLHRSIGSLIVWLVTLHFYVMIVTYGLSISYLLGSIWMILVGWLMLITYKNFSLRPKITLINTSVVFFSTYALEIYGIHIMILGAISTVLQIM